MGFVKGQGGRVRGSKNHVTKDVHSAFAKLGGPNGMLYAARLHELAVGKHSDPHVSLKALAIIVAYVWGKPKETTAHEGAITLRVTWEP